MYEVKKVSEVIDVVDENGEALKLRIKYPAYEQEKLAKLESMVAFKEAAQAKVPTVAQLESLLKESNVWSEEEDKELAKLQASYAEASNAVKAGGIKLAEGRKQAIEAIKSYNAIKNLLRNRQSWEANTVEALANDAYFNSLVSSCVLVYDSGRAVFSDSEGKPSLKAYKERESEQWVLDAANKLATMVYGSLEDSLMKLPEYIFLKKHKMIDKDFNFINSQGQRVDETGEKLIDSEGYYINEEGRRVTVDGTPVEKVETLPFLDDDGNPITED
jgi:hypothetical protein